VTSCPADAPTKKEENTTGHGPRGKTLALAPGTFFLSLCRNKCQSSQEYSTVLQPCIDPLRIGRAVVARWRTEFVVEEALFFDVLMFPFPFLVLFGAVLRGEISLLK